MRYDQIHANIVWDKLGDEKEVVCAVLDSTEYFTAGIYELTDVSVNTVIELINQHNTIFFIRQED